jgi:CheY-like chemotaxis protein
MTLSFDAPPNAPIVSARKCILVVEDEFLIRLLLSEVLRDAGYDVIEAFNGDEALSVLTSSIRLDLIVSDVRMPGSLDGIGLLRIVREALPELPVIITSGHEAPARALAEGATRFVAKPYQMDLVVRAVHDELAKPA